MLKQAGRKRPPLRSEGRRASRVVNMVSTDGGLWDAQEEASSRPWTSGSEAGLGEL